MRNLHLLTLVFFTALATGFANEASTNMTDEIRESVYQALNNSMAMYHRDFDVTAASRHLNTLIEKEVTGGAPLPVKIKKLSIMHRKGKGNFQADISGLPPQLQAQVQPQINELIKKTDLNKFWDKLTHSYLDIAEKAIREKGELELTKETEKYLILNVKNLDEPFHKEIHIKGIRLVMDKQDNLIKGVKLDLTEGKDLSVTMAYEMLPISGEDKPLPVWTSIRIQQKSWLGKVLGLIGWPNKMVMSFSDYKFEDLKTL